MHLGISPKILCFLALFFAVIFIPILRWFAYRDAEFHRARATEELKEFLRKMYPGDPLRGLQMAFEREKVGGSEVIWKTTFTFEGLEETGYLYLYEGGLLEERSFFPPVVLSCS